MSATARRGVRLLSTRSSSLGHRPLDQPIVLYEGNHLLAVDKPPGWRSIPDPQGFDKCLINNLQERQLGGGSKNQFLIPVHRIDQPCSGVLLIAKTKLAASRIQSQWKGVKKTYYVVTEKPLDEFKCSVSWKKLGGFLRRHRKNDYGSTKQGGWSVSMIACRVDDNFDGSDERQYKYCELEYKSLKPNVLEIRTNQGARHMIRALLACHGHSIAGDVRYGAYHALPDFSVALHARSVILPEHIKLGQTTERSFQAPIPSAWANFFILTEAQIQRFADANENHQQQQQYGP